MTGSSSDRPLSGQCVVVTRPKRQAAELSEPLASLGARVIEAPAISILPPDDPVPLEDALLHLDRFDWIVFTSINGVEEVIRCLGAGAASALATCRLAVVGPGTRSALEQIGVKVEHMPESFRVDTLAHDLSAAARGARFLLPRAERANPILPDVLRREGGVVTEVVAYRTVPEEGAADRAREALRQGEVTIITFTSASTVRGFVRQVPGDEIRRASPPPRIATIGPETSAAVREQGLEVHFEADPHTIDGLLSTIKGAIESHQGDT
ncbi:MAG: uroporphyrinogen-III synthase [Planctomycetota bacterium]|nr:uroporphyrinogen-III synthase [Planctomycetota bacterium]